MIEADRTEFRTSSYCSFGNCVEVGCAGDGVVLRDGKNRDGRTLSFTDEEWGEFVTRAKLGEFDPV